MKKNIFITGAAGYLGSRALNRLAALYPERQLIAFDLRPLVEPAPNVLVYAGDIRTAPLEDWFKKHDIGVVLHLAAVLDGSTLSRAAQYEIDVLGTQRVLDACVAAQVQRVIVSSSGAAYGYHADQPDWLEENDPLRGNTIFAYSDHKRQVEELLAKYRRAEPQLEQVVFRFCTIIGSQTQNLITNLFEGKRIVGLRGYETRFVFIWDEDAARLLAQAVEHPKVGIFNVAGDGYLTLKQIAKRLGKSYWALPLPLIKTGLRVLNGLKLVRYGPEQTLFLQYRPVLSNKALKEVYGFIPQKNSAAAFEEYVKGRGLGI